jgi:hypothetical protein
MKISTGNNILELCVEDMPVASAPIRPRPHADQEYFRINRSHAPHLVSDRAQYMPPVDIGDIMRAATVGVVVSSNDAAFAVGQHAVGFGGLAEHYVGISGQNV